jgi:hypothetical protein
MSVDVTYSVTVTDWREERQDSSLYDRWHVCLSSTEAGQTVATAIAESFHDTLEKANWRGAALARAVRITFVPHVEDPS